MQSARPSIIFQERPTDEYREKERKEKKHREKGRKDYRGARYLGEGDRARGDERWLYKTRLGEGGEGRGVGGGMQQSYLTV